MDARIEPLKMDEAEVAEPTVLGISPGGESLSSTWAGGAFDKGRARAVAVATSASSEAAAAAGEVSQDDEAGAAMPARLERSRSGRP